MREDLFRFTEGIRSDDAGYPQKGNTDTDVENFLATKIKPNSVYERVIDARFTPADRVLAFLEKTNTRKSNIRRTEKPRPESGLSKTGMGNYLDQSIVVVNVRNGLGTGFYVRKDLS